MRKWQPIIKFVTLHKLFKVHGKNQNSWKVDDFKLIELISATCYSGSIATSHIYKINALFTSVMIYIIKWIFNFNNIIQESTSIIIM